MRVLAVSLLVATVAVVGCVARQPVAAPGPIVQQPHTPAADVGSSVATLSPANIPAMPPSGSWAPEVTNPWFPLETGSIRTYAGFKDGQTTRESFVVEDTRKMILGVSATIVHDTLRTTSGKLIEDTHDWYAQDLDGNVWYLGEDTAEYKADGKTVDNTEGSWQAGVHGARAGVFMPTDPAVGYGQYQEYYKGQAEDQYSVVKLDASISVPFGTFPSGVLLTRETTALEPGVISDKYYVSGIGQVYEVDVQGSDEYNKLTAFTK